jgi:GNAT superfamily N-acetyltransferase
MKDATCSFETKTGLTVWLRPMRPTDAAHLVELFEHLGAESRYQRFQLAATAPKEELIWREARRLAAIDPDKGMGWLAFIADPQDPNQFVPIGGMRYMMVEAGLAEASLTVRDDMQRQGIGTRLMIYMLTYARQQGVERMMAMIQRANLGMWRLLDHSPVPFKRTPEGNYTHIELDLRVWQPDELAIS